MYWNHSFISNFDLKNFQTKFLFFEVIFSYIFSERMFSVLWDKKKIVKKPTNLTEKNNFYFFNFF